MAAATLFSNSCQAYEALLATPPDQLAKYDIAYMNLLCAHGLSGAEDMHIPKYLRRLNAMVERSRERIEAAIPRFRLDPDSFGVPPDCTEAMFRVGYLVHVLKDDFGLHYNEARRGEIEKFSFLGFQDSKDLLINGLLSDQRSGTCNSIPVIIVAVGRRLGFPLKLAANRIHVWARWETLDGGECFNIEASGPPGVGFPDDEHYKSFPIPMDEADIASGNYLKSFTPADELALFLFSRAWVLESNLRFEEGLDAWAKCCFLAPAEPMYPRRAYFSVLDMLNVRKFGKKLPRGRNHYPKEDVLFTNIPSFMPPNKAAMILSIKGHFHEVRQESGNAILAYKEACKLDPDNPDYPTDLDRYNYWLEKLEKLNHEKIKEWLKDPPISPQDDLLAPKVPAPAISVHKSHQPASKMMPDILASTMNARAMTLAEEGLKFEREEKLADAQAVFARGVNQTVSDVPMCRVYLHRVVRKEVLAGKAPAPFTAMLGKNLENPDDLDPRLKLSREMQGIIWAERGKVLEVMGRFGEAAHAYMQATILDPKRVGTPDVHRASQKVVDQHLKQKQAVAPAQRTKTRPFVPMLTVAVMPSAISYSIFTLPPAINLKPTVFYTWSKS